MMIKMRARSQLLDLLARVKTSMKIPISSRRIPEISAAVFISGSVHLELECLKHFHDFVVFLLFDCHDSLLQANMLLG